ncbi:MAG: hypothetical protein F4Y30_09560 [Chloroflexi bacterium]|nr:hypothetical protein [Chloroflexota bacterium]MYH66642.1 hypothetical protein [Chloroflexota bacterium]MYI41945.1 hypothetical protein [Chloroflexota bacterium]
MPRLPDNRGIDTLARELVRRFLLSLTLGLLLGIVAGAVIGWLNPPAAARNSRLGDLAQPHRDDYAIMIATGYAHDGDLAGALERLRHLEVGDLAGTLRATTERIINSGSRELGDIRVLARLAADLGGATPIMAPFLVGEGG